MKGAGRMSDEPRCSFCNKAQSEVRKLIAGARVFICDECVDLCVQIAETKTAEPAGVAKLCPVCRKVVPLEDLVAVTEGGDVCRTCVSTIHSLGRVDKQ
jgi:hypothetical protein